MSRLKVSRGILAATLGVLVALITWCWISGALQQLSINQDVRLTDQDAYVGFAIKVKESGFKHTGSRNRMPLYPFIQALFYDDGMTKAEYFARGNLVNVGITLSIVVMVFCIFAAYMPIYEASLATLIAGFTVFAYKAPYFQADVLYYGLALGVFVLCAECVMRPRWYMGAAAGGIAALAHLTKASILPAVVLAMACLVAHIAIDVRHLIRAPHDPCTRERAVRSITTMLSLVGVFLIVLSPYLIESKHSYGQYFYNVNSTTYIWYDSWSEVKKGVPAHGDRLDRSDFPTNETPSARYYFQTHTLKDVYKRLSRGIQAHYANIVHYRVAEYFLLYAGALLFVILANIRWILSWLADKRRFLTLVFAACYFSAYTLLYSFYAAIASGPRFILALVLPALFICALGTSRPVINSLPWSRVGRFSAPRIVSITLFSALTMLFVWELLVRFPGQIGTIHSSE